MLNAHNVSMRLMADAPRDNHRYLVEKKHLRRTLLWRFWSFLKQIRKTEKLNFLDVIANDCRCMTGLTLRKILLMTKCGDISELGDKAVKQIVFDGVPSNQEWRVGFLDEVIKSELDTIQAWICSS